MSCCVLLVHRPFISLIGVPITSSLVFLGLDDILQYRLWLEIFWAESYWVFFDATQHAVPFDILKLLHHVF